MMVIEILSTNRNLKDTVKEIENMLRTIDLKEMPSYDRYMESKKIRDEGIEVGISQGMSKGVIKTAITMIKEFNLSIEQVASKLNISIDELTKYLNKK